MSMSPTGPRKSRRERCLRSPLLAASAAVTFPGKVCAAASESRLPSAYVDLSGALASCETSSHKHLRQGVEDPGTSRIACSLRCTPREPSLEAAFEPWWDHKFPQSAMLEACQLIRSKYALSYLGAVVQRRVFFKCCSLGEDDCNGGPELQMLLSLIAELVAEVPMKNTYFLFNIGDQPFTDRVWWGSVPQFHWVSSPSYWVVPMPNPYHLNAHYTNRLGDSNTATKLSVPWSSKIAKVFWRGTLSSPDNFMAADGASLPRIRLMNLAAQHPHRFNVGITDVDDEMISIAKKTHQTQKLKALLAKFHTKDEVDMRATLPLYKYVINVSAVLSAWRLVELLSSGSVLILQEDSSSELIQGWLEPWVHFVPVRNSLSDLMAKLDWLEASPEEAEAIAARAAEQFRRRVRRQDTYCYLLQALRSLANATDDGPIELLGEGWHKIDPARAARSFPEHTPLKDMLQAGQALSEL